jgi:O-methyltransferase
MKSTIRKIFPGIYRQLALLKIFLKSPKHFFIYKKYKNFTMFVPYAYIENLKLIERFKNVPGAVVECGTWRGGMIAGFTEILGDSREYYLYDSFEGLPDAGERDGQKAVEYQTEKNSDFYYDNCRAEMAFAESAMKLSAAKKYKLVKGWFKDTLPGFDKSTNIAVLHLDGDWYDSIMDSLNNLFGSVVKGGVISIDDYGNWEGCTKAVHDFLSRNDRPEKIRYFNNAITYIIKE